MIILDSAAAQTESSHKMRDAQATARSDFQAAQAIIPRRQFRDELDDDRRLVSLLSAAAGFGAGVLGIARQLGRARWRRAFGHDGPRAAG